MLSEDVKVQSDGTVTGTLKHVTGYTGFNESVAAEQEGYFFPFRLVVHGKKMSFYKNGKPSKDIPWEADNVFRITSADTYGVFVDGKKIIEFNFANASFA